MPIANQSSSKDVATALTDLSGSASCAVFTDTAQFIEIDNIEVSCPHSTVNITNNDHSTSSCNAAATACVFAKATQLETVTTPRPT